MCHARPNYKTNIQLCFQRLRGLQTHKALLYGVDWRGTPQGILSDGPRMPHRNFYRMVGTSVTCAFIELEIRQFASAFSISSLALAASPPAGSVITGFNVISVN